MILFRITDTLFWTVSLFLDYIGVFHVFSIKPSEKKTTNKTIKGNSKVLSHLPNVIIKV